MSKTNCCNCGAALDIFAPKCAFCGTKNVNITDIDLDSGEAANFIFKLPKNIKGMNGCEVYMSMLAIPVLNKVEIVNNPVTIYGGYGTAPLMTYDTGCELQMNLQLHAVPKRSNELCRISTNKEIHYKEE